MRSLLHESLFFIFFLTNFQGIIGPKPKPRHNNKNEIPIREATNNPFDEITAESASAYTREQDRKTSTEMDSASRLDGPRHSWRQEMSSTHQTHNDYDKDARDYKKNEEKMMQTNGYLSTESNYTGNTDASNSYSHDRSTVEISEYIRRLAPRRYNKRRSRSRDHHDDREYTSGSRRRNSRERNQIRSRSKSRQLRSRSRDSKSIDRSLSHSTATSVTTHNEARRSGNRSQSRDRGNYSGSNNQDSSTGIYTYSDTKRTHRNRGKSTRTYSDNSDQYSSLNSYSNTKRGHRKGGESSKSVPNDKYKTVQPEPTGKTIESRIEHVNLRSSSFITAVKKDKKSMDLTKMAAVLKEIGEKEGIGEEKLKNKIIVKYKNKIGEKPIYKGLLTAEELKDDERKIKKLTNSIHKRNLAMND